MSAEIIKIGGGHDADCVTAETLMTLEEFVSWARGHPILPDDGETKDELRLGWNEAFEQVFRQTVAMTRSGQFSDAELANVQEVREWRRPVKAWLEDVFRAIQGTTLGKQFMGRLKRMPPSAQAQMAVDKSRAYGPTAGSLLELPPHLRRRSS